VNGRYPHPLRRLMPRAAVRRKGGQRGDRLPPVIGYLVSLDGAKGHLAYTIRNFGSCNFFLVCTGLSF
jgi:hypothetical protein